MTQMTPINQQQQQYQAQQNMQNIQQNIQQNPQMQFAQVQPNAPQMVHQINNNGNSTHEMFNQPEGNDSNNVTNEIVRGDEQIEGTNEINQTSEY